ncbi:hypothetical protein [Dactylosporangium sp. NPDC051541]|uniref:hypothetical protein n=1 Tax=Dactylosporangium sp. NPDC051541 TaxID=3363977 RepID=UPI0037BA28F5
MPESYKAYRLPDLWKILKDEDPESGFTHVNTLNRLRTALEQQRNDLRTHRDRLTEGWPPDRSEAAAAFVDRINDMIDVMTQTAGAANRMCIGVDEAFAAVRDARRQLESLMAKYSREPGPGLVVSNAKNAEQDQQGRAVLMAADARIIGAAEKINSVPPHYRRFDEQESDVSLSGNAGLSGTGQSTVGTGGNGSRALPTPVFDPPPPSTPVDISQPEAGTPDVGLSLARDPGVRTAPLASDVTERGLAWPDGVIRAVRGNSGSAPATPEAVPLRPGVVGPGGVISAPRSANTAAGQSTPFPATGVGHRTGSAPAGRRRPSARSAPPSDSVELRSGAGAAGGYRDRSYEAYIERRRSSRSASETNAVWAVREGVPPVIEPPPEAHHDPGPGVLGIDR